MSNCIFVLCNVSGTQLLAARQYAVNISMFTYLFAIAIGMGTAIIVGRFVGGSEKDEAYGASEKVSNGQFCSRYVW